MKIKRPGGTVFQKTRAFWPYVRGPTSLQRRPGRSPSNPPGPSPRAQIQWNVWNILLPTDAFCTQRPCARANVSIISMMKMNRGKVFFPLDSGNSDQI